MGKHYVYALGDYDHQKPVMIDPLLQATYFGGNGTESAIDMAIHPQTGDVYVLGQSTPPGAGFSNTFPGTAGGYLPSRPLSLTTDSMFFLARFSSDL